MTMRDLHNKISHIVAVTPQTIVNSGSPENLVSAGLDLANFEAAEVVCFLGDIDELGGSPVGSAKVEMILEHSDDDSTYAAVTLADVLGPSSVTSGVVATSTGDGTFLEVGYVGGKRYIRVTLQPTGLTNGGPVAAWVEKAHPRHAPQ